MRQCESPSRIVMQFVAAMISRFVFSNWVLVQGCPSHARLVNEKC
jgi:hypothetical protein